MFAQEEAKARGRVKSPRPTALGLGTPAWAIVQVNSPSFLATEKTKQTQQEKGGKAGKGREEQEGTGPAELSSFSGPAINSRTGESVCTAPTHRALQTHTRTKAQPPHTEGSTHPSFISGGRGPGCSNAAKRNPQLEKQTDKPTEPGILSISRDQSRGRQLTGIKT